MPWTRIHCYLIGMIFGCNYFTYKYERDCDGLELHPSKLSKLFTLLKFDNRVMLISEASGCTLMFLMMTLYKAINNAADDVAAGVNLLYLLFGRPLYIIGFTAWIMPFFLDNPMLRLFRNAMSHKFLVPYSRLIYGVFLCNTIFM